MNRLTLSLMILALPLAVQGCASKDTRRINSPSAADVEALVKAKPKATPDILKSQKAADQYSADVEAWGDSLSSAGKRVCNWFNDRGSKFNCGK